MRGLLTFGGRRAVGAFVVLAMRARLRKDSQANRRGRLRFLFLPTRSAIAFYSMLAASVFLSSCATKDMRHQMVVSVPDQKMALFDEGELIAVYPVSTSKFGLGDYPGSNATPLGNLEVADKIGGGAPLGAVFKDRRRTGEVLLPNAPGRDPIVTRILWLRGLESHNARAHARTIYIHGTPEERNIGRPASYGCIRMTSRHVAQLYDIVGEGARVQVVNQPLENVVPRKMANPFVNQAVVPQIPNS